MKIDWRILLRKAQHPALLVCATLPPALWLALNSCPAALKTLPLLALAFVAVCCGCFCLPGRWRLAGGAAGAAALFAAAWLLLPIRQEWKLLLLPLGYCAMLFALLPVAGWPVDKELSMVWIAVGFALHTLLQLAVGYARRSGSALYEPAEPLRLFSFLVFLALVALALNRSSLGFAAQARVRIPAVMQRKNTVFTLVLLAAALLLAALPAIAAALDGLWQRFLQAVGSMAAFLASLLARSGGEGMGGEAGDPAALVSALEEGQVSWFHRFLEILVAVVAVAALAVLLFCLGRILWRKGRQLVRYLWQQLTRFGSVASRDYEDEVTDTRDDGEYRQNGLVQRLRTRLTRVDESRLTPAQRVRYRYLRLRLRHGEWQQAETARETLPRPAAQLYEQVRYGGQQLTQEEADAFREMTRKL